MSMKNVLVSPSILASNFLVLKEEILKIENAGANFVHFDVMDGHFVNNISFGLPILKSVKEISFIPIDTHLMILNPMDFYKRFYEDGSFNVTVHAETVSVNEFKEISEYAHSKNLSCGITFRPGYDISNINEYLKYADIVLVMSVEPGFGGQKFINESLYKIKYLYNYRLDHDLKFLIEVDGGINDATGKECVLSGADILVAGSYIFKNKDYNEAIMRLKKYE